MTKLVIVESPTKAKTLRRFLGDEYLVESSVGHVRDLPASAAEIPADLKKEPWARLGVNVDEGFRPLYVVQPEKKKVITELKQRLKKVDELLLATDEDREGEAISWHLLELLKPRVPVKRMVFHEITKTAILEALEHTREVDMHLVDAQETRRIIDRLYGYEVSPILWRKIAPKLSAGRVQSVAIRMLVERERARLRFQAADYWDLAVDLPGPEGATFPARLAAIDGQRLASGKDFDPDSGRLRGEATWHLLGEEARRLATALEGVALRVSATEEKPFSRAPAPPFTTSTLQQEGVRKLRFEARRTMRAAQALYENGFITYMRTDSVVLSQQAIDATRAEIKDKFGADHLPEAPRTYKSKVKNAQEAHEAIRPVGEPFPSKEEVEKRLGADSARVYELIWQRTMACQMESARGRRMVVRLEAQAGGRTLTFQANGNVIDFFGFLRAYAEGSDDPDEALEERQVVLPPVREGDQLVPRSIDAKEHRTQPPARLTEASLVKALEESGIGRPSTYASIISTIERREYTFKKGTALVPTWLAFAVVRLMEGHFQHLVDYEFTAAMEDRLDGIARGESESQPYLREFYFGNGAPGLHRLVEQKVEEIDPRQVCSQVLGQDPEGQEVVVRVGRYGPYVQRGESERANLPQGVAPDELTLAGALDLLATAKKGLEPLGRHPTSGEPIYVKAGRFGPYVQLGDAKDADGNAKAERPKMVSLLPEMSPQTLTLEQALSLLSLPRLVGQDAEGVPIEAHFGRYGAYIRRGKDTRSLEAQDHVLTIGVERALALLAQEKRRGRSARKELKVYADVAALEGATIRMFEGRYGPYVTDGETNASLPRDYQDPTALTEGEAVSLILARRDLGPAKKKAGKKKKVAKKAKAAAPAAAGDAGDEAGGAATQGAAKPSRRRAARTSGPGEAAEGGEAASGEGTSGASGEGAAPAKGGKKKATKKKAAKKKAKKKTASA